MLGVQYASRPYRSSSQGLNQNHHGKSEGRARENVDQKDNGVLGKKEGGRSRGIERSAKFALEREKVISKTAPP